MLKLIAHAQIAHAQTDCPCPAHAQVAHAQVAHVYDRTALAQTAVYTQINAQTDCPCPDCLSLSQLPMPALSAHAHARIKIMGIQM